MPAGKSGLHAAEGAEGFLRSQTAVKHRPRTYQKRSIRALVRMTTTVIVDGAISKSRIFEFIVQHLTEAICVSEIQRTEVQEKVPIHQLIINGEEMLVGVLHSRRGTQCDIINSCLQG